MFFYFVMTIGTYIFFFIFTGSKAQCYGECAGLPVKRTGCEAWLGLCVVLSGKTLVPYF